MTLLHKIASIPPVCWLWGILFLLLAGQFFWSNFMAYPAAFERQLRGGKTWVYIPLRWKGFYKSQISSLSRILILAIAADGTALFLHYAHRKQPWILIPVALVLAAAAVRLGGLWNHLRYRQQEDGLLPPSRRVARQNGSRKARITPRPAAESRGLPASATAPQGRGSPRISQDSSPGSP